jgi:Phosphodiester glycosidase
MRLAALLALLVAACHAGAHDPGAAAADPAPRDAAARDARAARAAGDAPCDGQPVPLARGVTAERWRVAGDPALPDRAPCVDLVRVDLARYQLRILAAARDGGARPAPKWADDFALIAAINLSMFGDDGAPVALAVDGRGPLHERDNKQFGGFLAFDPVDPHDAPAVVAGRDCPGFDLGALRRRYRALVQSYRLLDCDGGAIAWKDAKSYSAAAVGVDRAGRLVLVHVRAPFTMRALSAALAEPDLALAGAIFVEGGPEASLVVHGDRTLERVGSFETGFVETDDNHRFWDLPNVIGVIPR